MVIIDYRSRVPIYEQIKNQIMSLIQLGVYQPYEQLPSIRGLAQELSLNVNTVKRAFSDLEADGVICSLPGRGSFVMENALGNERMRAQALETIRTAIDAARAKGIRREEVALLLDELYPEGDKTVQEEKQKRG